MLKEIFKNPSLRFCLFIVLAVLFLFLGRFVSIDKAAYENFFSRIPTAWSGVIFIVLYVVLSFFIWLGPKDILKIVGALMYGTYLSTLLVFIAEMINLIALFSLSRFLGRAFVEKKLPGKMQNFDQAIAKSGFFSIFFLRFFPVVPFRFLDLGFGLTKISLRRYLIIAMVASPVRIFFVQLFLALGLDTVMNPNKLTEYLAQNPNILGLSFVYVVGSIVMVFIWKQRARKRSAGN